MNQQPFKTLGAASILCLSATLAFGAEAPDTLWQKALGIARANSGWVAGLVVTRSEIVYKSETNAVHEIWRRSSLGQAGQVVTETVKMVEDGKDVTAREKKTAPDEKKTSGGMVADNPFDPAAQSRLSLTSTIQPRTISGKECVGYKFEVKSLKGPITQGVAWLERETGIPAELENVTVNPLPDKHLKSLSMTTRFEVTSDGVWRPKEVKTSGTIRVLFFNTELQSKTTFSEYWKKPPRTQDAASQ